MKQENKRELKKRHNVMLTDSAWKFLDWLQIHKLQKFKSRSSAIEYLIDSYKKAIQQQQRN